MRTRRGFSMVELIVVLLLLGLMAAAITLRLQSPLYLARIKEFKEDMTAYDRLTRKSCLEQNRAARLWIDLTAGRIERRSIDGTVEYGTSLQLPRDLKIVTLRIGRQDVIAGRFIIPFSRWGLSPTYGLCVEASEGDRHWLVLSGLTGQPVEPQEDVDVRDIFLSKPSPPDGLNAH